MRLLTGMLIGAVLVINLAYISHLHEEVRYYQAQAQYNAVQELKALMEQGKLQKKVFELQQLTNKFD